MAPHHSFAKRASITLSDMDRIMRDGSSCRVIMTRAVISVGCTDISIEAAREIMRLYEKNFPVVKEPESVVIQP